MRGRSSLPTIWQQQLSYDNGSLEMLLYFVLVKLFAVVGVGYKVGGDTPVQYLVLQVHYKEVAQFIAPSKYFRYYNAVSGDHTVSHH